MNRYSRTGGRGERGASLFIALISLVIMTLAGLALVRSVDTANVISGNLAFRRASLNLTDLGVQAAYAWLADGARTLAALDAKSPAACDPTAANSACVYYPDWDPNPDDDANDYDEDDTEGVRIAVGNWGNVPCVYPSGGSIPSGCPATSTASAAVPSGYFYRYVIERMCLPGFAAGGVGATMTTRNVNCLSSIPPDSTTPISYAAAGTPYDKLPQIFYRVTVRVDGPRNTLSRTQVILSKPVPET